MSYKIAKRFSILAMLITATVVGLFMYKIAGRSLAPDFVRAFLSIFFAFLSTILLLRLGWKKVALTIHFTLGMVATLIISLMYVYYQSINAVFTGDDVVAIAQSNPEEIYDFFSHYILNSSSLITVAIICGWYILCAWSLVKSNYHQNKFKVHSVKAMTYSALAIVLAIASLILNLESRPAKYYRLMVNNLENNLNTFAKITADLEKSSVHSATKEGKGELYVLVIGESLSRESMGVYNHSVNNTPFLNLLAQSEQTLVYQNSYSSFVNTVPSITASFSQGNLTTGLTFPYGENLISMAKKAGIKTHWISNQVKNGKADTPIGAISALANDSYFTTNFVFDGSYSQKPDLVLMPKLQETIKKLDPKDNNLLIVHIMGSHSPYYNRFDEDFPKITLHDSSHIGMLANQERFDSSLLGSSDYENYLTSISYNDHFLQELYKLIEKRPDFQAMLYYSDHGEQIIYSSFADAKDADPNSPAGRHNVAQFNFAMTRIPLIINLSNSYVQKYPQSFNALKEHQNEIFTNDNLYDLLLDLMQVKSQSINYALSPANELYDRGNPLSVSLTNNQIVGKDPEYIAWQNAHQSYSDQIIIKGTNSIFKANMTLMRGYQNLALDTLLHQGTLYVKSVQKYDSSFLTIDQYLQSLALEKITADEVSYKPQGKFKFYILVDDQEQPVEGLIEGIKQVKHEGLTYIVNNLDLYLKLHSINIDCSLYIDNLADFKQALSKGISFFTLNGDNLEDLQINSLSQDPQYTAAIHQGQFIMMFNKLVAQDNTVEQTIIQTQQQMPKLKINGFIIGSNNAFDSDFVQSFE